MAKPTQGSSIDAVSVTVEMDAGSTATEVSGTDTLNPSEDISRSTGGTRSRRALDAMAQWEWKSSGLKWQCVLGAGSFGTVYQVAYGDELLAAKCKNVSH